MASRFRCSRAGKMGLSHASATAEIELVEAALSPPSQRECGLARKRVAGSDDEALEAEGQLRLNGAAPGIASGIASGMAKGNGSRSH